MAFEYTRGRLLRGASLGVIFVFCLPLAAPALAQARGSDGAGTSPDQASAGAGVPDIVVTAQKRSELLSKIPLAISVIGQQTMDNVGARSFTDAATTLPNVSTGLGQVIAIRGLGTSSLNSTNGTVAFHVDGIFQNSIGQGASNLYDIQRVEVLRGPQGTLYGRNATAGVVNVLTNDASQKFEAFGDVSYGAFNTLSVRGVVNVPVTDKFAVRLTGTYDKSDSYQVTDGQHAPAADVLDLRLAWKVKPVDGITWDGRVEYNDNRGVQPVGVPYFFYNSATQQYIPTGNPRNSAELGSVTGTSGLQTAVGFPYGSVYQGLGYDDANRQHVANISVRSKLRADISSTLSLNYLMGYTNIVTNAGTTAGLIALQVVADRQAVKDWSHELDLNLDTGRIKAVLGGYSFDHDLRAPGGSLSRIFGASPALTAAEAGSVLDYTVPLIDQSQTIPHDKAVTRAIFGQATISITSALRLTGGARYNWDRVSYQAFTTSTCPFGSGLSALQPDVATIPAFIPGLGGAPVCSTLALFSPTFYANRTFPGASRSFQKFSWKASVEYDVNPNTLAYATVATGYKAGGVADKQAAGDLRFFKPETDINFEAGIKTKLLDNKLNLGLTAFWTDYKDLQVAVLDPNNIGQQIFKNAGRSRSRGVEFEYAFALTRSDNIHGFLTYLDAKFRDFPSLDPLSNLPQNFAGNRLPGSPKVAGRIAYSHIIDLGSAGTITPTAQFYFQGTSYQSYANNAATRVPGYTRSDLIVRYETQRKNIFVEGFVNNIEDKQILQSAIPIQGVSIGYFSAPRTFGARVGFRY
jgi:iron complex outermembrane recepter protein